MPPSGRSSAERQSSERWSTSLVAHRNAELRTELGVSVADRERKELAQLIVRAGETSRRKALHQIRGFSHVASRDQPSAYARALRSQKGAPSALFDVEQRK